MRTSAEFRTLWCTFIEANIKCTATPTLYQFITDSIFKTLVQQQFQIEGTEEASVGAPLSLQEENVINYAAGYVCRAIRKRLERSSDSEKAELILCVMELLQDDDEDNSTTDDQEWVNLVDRGGLWHISENTFMVFRALEEGIRKHFKKIAARGLSVGRKDEITTALYADEDVQLFWSIASAEFDEESAKTLLKMIVELWITIRGFSFCSAWVEQYKQSTKKTIQRSKALCRELHTSDVSNV